MLTRILCAGAFFPVGASLVACSRSNVYVPVIGEGSPCSSTDDCMLGWTCEDGVCAKICETELDCPTEGYACEQGVCQLRTALDCDATPHGESESCGCYAAASVPYRSVCVFNSDVRICNDGVWDPDCPVCANPTCVVEPPLDCSATLHGETESCGCYEAASVPYGSVCVFNSDLRVCDNGVWDPDCPACAHSTCIEEPPLDCDDEEHLTVEHRTRYRDAAVRYNETCISEDQTRTCNNGTWSNWTGTYTFLDCIISDAVVLVQQDVTSGMGVSLSMTLSDPTTAGNLLVLIGANRSSGLSSVTGGGVAAWDKATSSTTHANIEIWYGVVSSTSSSAVTMTAPVSGRSRMNLTEWNGLLNDQEEVLDQSASRSGEASPASSPAITTTVAATLLVFGVDADDPTTFGDPTEGPWEALTQIVVPSGEAQAAWYRVALSTGTFQPAVASVTLPWDAAIAAFEIQP